MEKGLEKFTLSLAIVDSIPVLLFSISMYIIHLLFDSKIFFIGALSCILAGTLKVLWKFIVAIFHKDIPILSKQLRLLMPIGFILMIASIFIDRNQIHLDKMLSSILHFPSCIFFLIGILGMCLMGYFGKHLDGHDVKSNWIEQLTNAFAQLCILIGLLLLL